MMTCVKIPTLPYPIKKSLETHFQGFSLGFWGETLPIFIENERFLEIGRQLDLEEKLHILQAN